MQDGLLPIFPLQLVLLPRTVLPLHIFEERYKEMVGEAIGGSTEFGIVLARGEGILRTGCTAAVEKVVERYPDGRMDIVTSGRRRFQIDGIDTERSFLRAGVEFFDDDDFEPGPTESIRRALAAHAAVCELTGEDGGEAAEGDPQLSFRLARISQDADFRQTLLPMRSEAQRMILVADHMEALFERHVTRARATKAAARNGHTHPR